MDESIDRILDSRKNLEVNLENEVANFILGISREVRARCCHRATLAPPAPARRPARAGRRLELTPARVQDRHLLQLTPAQYRAHVESKGGG